MKRGVEIHLAEHSADSRIVIDGTDVTAAVRSVSVTQRAGQLSMVALECLPSSMILVGDAEIVIAPCPTCGGGEDAR